MPATPIRIDKLYGATKRRPTGVPRYRQKFFASFFQKRRLCSICSFLKKEPKNFCESRGAPAGVRRADKNMAAWPGGRATPPCTKPRNAGGGDCIAAVCYNPYGHGLLKNNSQEVVTAGREINGL
jgi:hypothetical protein